MPRSNISTSARWLPARLRATAVALAGLALTAAPGVRGAATTVMPHPAAHALPHLPPVNAHLHGIAVEHAKVDRKALVQTHWAHRWNATAWFALHRGTGVVQGVVRNGQGYPLGGMNVRLRNSRGGALRSVAAKHITTTGAGGTFLMTGVRAGRYRVHAQGNGHQGGSPVVVHSGQAVLVGVKV